VSLAAQPWVGSAAARVVHGHSAGALPVLLGAGTPVPATGATPTPIAQPAIAQPPVAQPAIAERAVAQSGVVPVEVALGELGLVPRDLDTGAPGWLGRLADLADTGAPALVVVARDLDISTVALLDLLDRPGDVTAVATVEPVAVQGNPSDLTLLRVEPGQALVHSVGSTRHTVTSPTGYAAGVLRIGGDDLETAVRLWRAAATSASAADPGVDGFDLALLVLVRGGLSVGVVPLGPFTFRRRGAHSDGAAGSPWQQRLRGASRGGDGFFSTFVVRPLSRRVTAVGLRLGWTPNAVTVGSLLVGLLASALAAVDNRWAWAAAAILLLLSLVVDCVDGEIARFTRRFSALGAWLDAVGDRIKEYSLVAAVAWVSVRRGEPMWLLATVAMVLVTARHLEDYAYSQRNKASRAVVVPDLLDVDEPRDLGPADGRTTVPGPMAGRAVVRFWVRKVLHLPIAERYLLLSLGLLTFSPRLLLWSLTGAATIALVWTQGGHTFKALRGVDGFRPEQAPSATHWGQLDHQVDLGPLARAVGRLAALPFAAAVVGCVLVGLGALVVAAADATPWLVVALAAVGILLVGAGCRPPLQDPLGWQASTLLWGAEAALVLAVAGSLPGRAQWCAYVYLAAVAWHRYDVAYRLRDTGLAAAPWVTVATLGVDGRWLLLAVTAALGGPVGALLAWGSLVLICVYAAESAAGWRAWARAATVVEVTA
jgi:hypothetical protein